MTKVIFFIGRPATGKSTIAKEIKVKLQRDKSCCIIDADDMHRFSLLPLRGDFSLEARHKRALQLTNIIKWASEQFDIVIVAAIGQPSSARKYWRQNISDMQIVYLQSNIEDCKLRDFKGIYSKSEFVVGKDIPFEPPLDSDIIIDTSNKSVNEVTEEALRAIF